tara:strand:- start:47 stop:322 length:276 start_codon:yes stop_codon:yes gene_type:complete
MTVEKVWAIVEVDYGVDGKGKPMDVIKKIYDCRLTAQESLFKPYIIREMEIDTKQVVINLSKKLTELEKYSVGCYNERGINDYLIKGGESQ